MKSFLLSILLTIFFAVNVIAQVEKLHQELKKEQSDSTKNLILIKIGMAHLDFDSALFYFEKVIQNSKKSGSKYYEGLATNEMALRYFKISQNDSALYYWEQARTILSSSINERNRKKHEPLIGEIHYRIAVPNYYKGNYKTALEQLNIALRLYKKNQVNKGVINCYNILGNIHFAQNELDLAVKQYTYGIEFALVKQQLRSLTALYNNLASVYLEQKHYEKAKSQYLLSIRYIDKSNEMSLAQTNMNIGLANLRLGQIEEAEKYLLKNKEFYELTTHLRTKITWLNMLGELYLRKEDWKNSVGNAREVLKELESMPLVLIKKSALDQLSRGYEGMGQHRLALKYFKEHTKLQDSLFTEDKTKEIKKLEAQLEFDKKEREIDRLEKDNLANTLALKESENTRNVILFASIGLFLLIVVVWVYNRKKQDRRRHAIEMKRVELEQRMLRSQMNPHFIFNALNSIQSFVSTKKTYEAEVFLSKFSMLIRKILENSTHKSIDIEEEIDTLKLYMELEKLRFQNKFDFIIKEDFSDNSIPVPPMLLQPFVENAIVHGMKGKTGQGKIEVRFIEKEDSLICEVEDNGVGRKTVKIDHMPHKSMAIELINDRISYFNQETDQGNYRLEITDLTNEEGTPCGTKVNLTIPLLA